MDKDVVHIYNGMLLSQRKMEILPFAAVWRDLEHIMPSEIIQAEKDKNRVYFFTSFAFQKSFKSAVLHKGWNFILYFKMLVSFFI